MSAEGRMRSLHGGEGPACPGFQEEGTQGAGGMAKQRCSGKSLTFAQLDAFLGSKSHTVMQNDPVKFGDRDFEKG